MRSWAFLISRRWITFALVVALLAYLAWWLGEWQFRRLDDRKERNAIFERNVKAEPAPANDVFSSDHELAPTNEWRTIRAVGHYDATNTIAVRYQTRKGSSGIDVVVPFVTDSGSILLIDRGWKISSNDGAAVIDPPAPPAGVVNVVGWARRNATGSSTAVHNKSTRAISSTAISKSLGVDLLRGFVMVKSETPKPTDPLLAVELPDVGNGPHFFYGLQWWFFGLLAVGGFGYLAYDERRGSPGRRATVGRP